MQQKCNYWTRGCILLKKMELANGCFLHVKKVNKLLFGTETFCSVSPEGTKGTSVKIISIHWTIWIQK